MDAVIAGQGGKAEIGDDEPLGGALRIVLGAGIGRLSREHIDAGLQAGHRLAHRKVGGDLGVQLLLDLELAGPYLLALLVGDIFQRIACHVALEIAAEHRVDQAAVADPVDRDLDGVGVDGNERDAALARLGQHIGLAGEPHEGAPVAHIDIEVGRLEQALIHRGGKAGAERHGVALAVLQPFDAELLVVDGQRGLVLPDHRHVRREVGALGQGLGELEAGARGGRVGIDAEIRDAEAVFLPQAVIGGLELGRLMQLERQLERVQRRSPLGAFAIGIGERDQGVGLVGGIGRPLIGDIGRRRRPLEARAAVVIGADRNPEQEIGEPAPGEPVIGGHGDDLDGDVGRGLEVVLLDRRVGVLLELKDRLLDPRLAFQVGLKGDGGIVESGVLERLFGGLGGGGDKDEQRGSNASAEPCEH